MIKLQKSRSRRARYGFTANGVPFERRELLEFYDKAPRQLRANPFKRKGSLLRNVDDAAYSEKRSGT